MGIILQRFTDKIHVMSVLNRRQVLVCEAHRHAKLGGSGGIPPPSPSQ